MIIELKFKASWAVPGLLFGITACGRSQTQAPPSAGPAQARSSSASGAGQPPNSSAASGTQAVGDTSIVASDTSGGVDLSFAGPPHQLESLRARVRALADQHNALASGGTHNSSMHCPCAAIVPTGCCGMMGRTDSTAGPGGCCVTGGHGMMGGNGYGMGGNGCGDGHGMMHDGGGCCGGATGQAAPPPVGSTATVRGVDTGAVMSLAATKSSDVDALRQQVHACVDHVQHGGCPMMRH